MLESWLTLVAVMLATGVIAGLLAGLFGIGGGIVIVPVLEAALSWYGVDPAIRMHVAVATSLATIIPTSISSARSHYRRQSVNVAVAKRWAPWVLAGSLVGAWVASRVDSSALAVVFATVTFLVASKTALDLGVRKLTDDMPSTPLVGAIPAAIGAISTMMGIGGGVLSVIALRLFNQPIRSAIGTAALLGLAISVPGTLGLVAAGWDDPRLPPASAGFVSLVGFAAIAPVTVACAPLGARIAHSVAEHWLNRGFAVLLFAMSARLFYRAFA
jgi:uncharacterized membrane protein YfcA